MWNNAAGEEFKKDPEEFKKQNAVAMTMGNQPPEKIGSDENSPHYSRPPSSTFKGYSFMNFRNDSVSSVGGGGGNGNGHSGNGGNTTNGI